MKGRSFTEYMQRQFKEFYDGVLDADWVMCSVLHGGHWTLAVMSMLDGKMVYLDSLYDGVTAKTAFTRLSKFLERMAAGEGSRKFVSEEWQYYVIPASDLPQQLNSVDCGVFVAKLAQHIAEGKPLDFTQANISDFRLSFIIDMRNNKLSEIIECPNRSLKRSTKPAKKTKKTPVSNKGSRQRNVSDSNPLSFSHDSDSDFEPTQKCAKRGKGKQGKPGREEHNYARTQNTDTRQVDGDIPESLKKIFSS